MSDKSLIINKKLNDKKKLYEQLNILIKKEKEIQIEIDNISKEIFKICDHNWVRDDSSYGPYEKPDYICTICHSIDYRW